MRATLGVPNLMVQSLAAFVEAEGLPLVVANAEDCAVRVVESERGQPSTASVLRAGGSISCALARQMALRLGIELGQIGRLLNHLDVKIRACELGCFK